MEGTIGEIRLFAGPLDAATNKVPRGWKVCDGALLEISENFVLYAILGATYGGDGVSTFALPDLRGRVPVGAGAGPERPAYTLTQQTGAEQVPTQPVTVSISSTGTAVSLVTAASRNNVQPVLALNYIICFQGEFPQET